MFRLGFRKRVAGNYYKVFDKVVILQNIRNLGDTQNASDSDRHFGIPGVEEISEVKQYSNIYYFVIKFEDSEIRKKFGLESDEEMGIDISIDGDFNLKLELGGKTYIKYRDIIFNFRDRMNITYNEVCTSITLAVKKMFKSGKSNTGR